jgi:hypothetical protein
MKLYIKQVKKATFLGIVIDEFLSWSYHIDNISKKIVKCTAILSRIRHFTNINSLKLIYYALVYPYLIYGNLVWGNAQPRSQGFSLFVIGKAGKGPGTGRSHDFQHPDIVGVINYNNNE